MKNTFQDNLAKKSRIQQNSIYKTVKSQIRRFVFPTRCPGCDEILYSKDEKRGFCPKCAKSLRLVGEKFCMHCGVALKKEQEQFCSKCKQHTHHFAQHRGIYLYKPPMKGSMYKFKYSNRRCYARVYARDARRFLGDWLDFINVDAIIPVPMFLRKEKRRGYNQATAFAIALSEQLELPYSTKIVARVKNSLPMKTLDEQQRKNNLKNAFKVRDIDIKSKKILLVDDIYTTGATMDAVSAALLEAGAASVYGLSICIGEDRPRR